MNTYLTEPCVSNTQHGWRCVRCKGLFAAEESEFNEGKVYCLMCLLEIRANNIGRRVSPTVATDYGPARISLSHYHGNGTPAIQLIDTDGELITTLSVNLPGSTSLLDTNQFFAKTWSENESIAAQALASPYFKDTGGRVPTGYVEAEIWEMTEALLDLL